MTRRSNRKKSGFSATTRRHRPAGGIGRGPAGAVRGLSLVVLSAALLVGCVHAPRPAPVPGKTEPVELDQLPLAARFSPIGSVGAALRVSGGTAAEVRLPVSQGAAKELLPATLRLFRFDEKASSWSELDGSRYDSQTGELVGSDLQPGLYTGFGWSANPAVNAMQRILLDTSLGYGSLSATPDGVFGSGLGGGDAQDDPIGEFRRLLLRGWLELSFTYEITSCQTSDEPRCPLTCRRAASRGVFSSCVVDGVDCSVNDCCDCVTGSFTERFVIPRGFLDTLPIRCPRPGPFCPACPNGLSCPDGPFAQRPEIAPTLEAPDYGFLEGLGLGAVIGDPVLREELQNVVEGLTGREYPVPPPWN